VVILEFPPISTQPDIGRKLIEILLVEDNADQANLMMYALRENNLAEHAHVVGDGQEALEFLFCTGRYAARKDLPRPRIMILDLKLPVLSGIEVLRRIKEQETTRSVPVVVMTASRVESDIEACYDLGVNSYLLKPMDYDKFSEVVRSIGHYWLRLNQVPHVHP
jgi:two-component system, response regulator